MDISNSENNSFYDYEKLQINVFLHTLDDLFEILVNNKQSFDDIKNISNEELFKQKGNVNFTKNQLVDILLQKLSINQLNDELDKFESYKANNIIEKNFPYGTARNCQLETISKIYDAIEQGYKYIVLEAVSGFGKSAIAATLAKIYSQNQSYFLVINHQLASQYMDEFPTYGFEKMDARSSFDCKLNSKKSCNVSSCESPDCIYFKNSNFSKNFDAEDSCNFLFKLKESINSEIMISTYAFFILENFYQSNYLKKRKLLICDEAHNLDEMIADNVGLTFYKNDFEVVELDIDEINEDLNVNEDYYYFLLRLKSLFEVYSKKFNTYSEEFDRCQRNLNRLSKFLLFFENDRTNIFFEKSGNRYAFKPIHVNTIINEALLKYGDVCIFMSSSIFDYKNFASDLGITEEDIYFLRVPNVFNLSDNPIKIFNEFNMKYSNLKDNAEDSLEIIENILEDHSNEKGIIHTFSYECKNYIVENLDSDRIIWHDNNNDREEILGEFKKSDEPLVLVSPSMDEGVDLPGDYCRFQIIYKLPYKPYKNTRIGKRKAVYDDGDSWYRYKMLTKLIQMYGRGIRFEGDYCKTYILDNRLWGVIEEDLEETNIIPSYFLHSIIDSDE